MADSTDRISIKVSGYWGSAVRFALWIALAFVIYTGCAAPDSGQDSEKVAKVTSAMSVDEVWGFEDASDWTVTSGPATKVASTIHTEGDFSLQLTGPGFMTVQGDSVEKPTELSPFIAVDVMIPPQAGPYYYGAVQMWIRVPSLEIDEWVGQHELSVPTGVWQTLTFELSDEIYDQLIAPPFSDLQISIGVNSPQGLNQPFRLDNLRFLPAPSCVGQPNGTFCDDLTDCTFGATCLGGVCGTIITPPPGVSCDPSDDVMGFENFPAWQVSEGASTLAPSTTHVQGERSLQISTVYFTTVSSIPLAMVHKVSSTLSLSVRKPTHQPNQWWHGDITVSIDVPSLGLEYSQTQPLTGHPNGSFFELTFDLPSDTVAQLASSTYSDLTFSISVNPPNGQNGFYLLDDLHFVPIPSCTGSADNIACDDGSLCTQGDSCQSGTCGAPVTCDDGNVCTTDTCNSAFGCVFTTNTAACDDGNACTTGDQCSGGVCMPGGPTDCNDGNVCTDDSCVAPTGCVNTANTLSCNDGNVCTGVLADGTDSCSAGVCTSGPPISCDDGSNCTIDSCSNPGGCMHAWACGSGVCVANNCCMPQTCATLGAECGVHPDGCGGTIDCNPICPAGGSCNPAFQCLPPNEYSEPSGINVCEILLEDLIIPAITADVDECLDFDFLECAAATAAGHPDCCIPGACLLDPFCYFTHPVVVVAEQIYHAGDLYCAFRSPREYLEKILNGTINTAEQWAAFIQTGGLTGLLDFDVTVMANAGSVAPSNARQLIRDLTAPIYNGGATGFSYDDMDNVTIVSSDFPTAGLYLPGARSAITLGPVIVLNATLYDALFSSSNSGVTYSDFLTNNAVCQTYIAAVDVLIHELVHVHQYAEIGRYNFYTQYLGSALVNEYGDIGFEEEAFDYHIDLSDLQGGNYCSVMATAHNNLISGFTLPTTPHTCAATGPASIEDFPGCP